MRRWMILVGLALAFTLAPASAQAQITPACSLYAFQSSIPFARAANAFGTNGVYPVGFQPLTRPFATPPGSYAMSNLGYAAPYGLGSLFPPGTMIPGGAPPPLPAAPTPADQSLSVNAILQSVQADGTLDAMPPDQRANFLVQLAQLRQTEIANATNQANLAQQTQVNYVNIQRVPYDLASEMQQRAKEWRDSYNLSAQTVFQITNGACTQNSGLGPAVNPLINPLLCQGFRAPGCP